MKRLLIFISLAGATLISSPVLAVNIYLVSPSGVVMADVSAAPFSSGAFHFGSGQIRPGEGTQLALTSSSWDGRDFSPVDFTGAGRPPPVLLSELEGVLVVEPFSEGSLNQLRQAMKPPMRKYYENMFFDLIDELLVLTNNPQEPTPKLGFPELQGLINQIQSTDPTAAVNLSLNLLTIDAALKRYDMMWWDNAIRHDLGE